MTSHNQHLPCPCGKSSDAFSIQDNGWGKCFSCDKNFPPKKSQTGMDTETLDWLEDETASPPKQAKPFSPLTTVFKAFDKRGLSEATIKRYGVDIGSGKYEAKYPQFDTDNNHVGNKVRYEGKEFSFEGTAKGRGLFGRQAFPAGSAKAITLVEGQDDAMAVYQMTGSKYPAVSVDSASSALRDVKNDFEYLNSFETIVVCFDNDEPGRRAAKQVAQAGFPLGKVKVLTLRNHKDANDYLMAKEAEAFTREWWQAPSHKPDGLKLGSEMWQEIIDRKESFCTPYPFPALNEKTFGIRLSELVVVTADTGVGKTSFLKHVEHALLTNEEVVKNGYGVGFLHLEEPNGDTALGLISVHNSVPYHLPTSARPEKDIREAFETLLNNDRVVIWDHFGSNTVDAVLDKVRHMVALGCKYIVLDHLSIVVSDQSGDERKQLDEITTKLKTLTMELDIAVIAVIHTNRKGEIRGTAGVEQLSNIVFRLEREIVDPSEWRRNITKITVVKNRFCGYTGPSSYLWYNPETARLTELEADQILLYENGGSINDEDLPWA